MKGTLDYEHALTLPASPAGVLLAQIAAPFVAAGQTEREALHKAYFLTCAADNFITEIEMNALRRSHKEHSTVGIDTALEYVGLKSRVRFKELLTQTQGSEVVDKLWGSAIKGERVFTPEIWERVKAARKQALIDRNRAASKKRSENNGKKKHAG